MRTERRGLGRGAGGVNAFVRVCARPCACCAVCCVCVCVCVCVCARARARSSRGELGSKVPIRLGRIRGGVATLAMAEESIGHARRLRGVQLELLRAGSLPRESPELRRSRRRPPFIAVASTFTCFATMMQHAACSRLSSQTLASPSRRRRAGGAAARQQEAQREVAQAPPCRRSRRCEAVRGSRRR